MTATRRGLAECARAVLNAIGGAYFGTADGAPRGLETRLCRALRVRGPHECWRTGRVFYVLHENTQTRIGDEPPDPDALDAAGELGVHAFEALLSGAHTSTPIELTDTIAALDACARRGVTAERVREGA